MLSGTYETPMLCSKGVKASGTAGKNEKWGKKVREEWQKHQHGSGNTARMLGD